MEKNNYTVYVHISPSNKYYVGITSQTINKRWHNGKAYKPNKHFYYAIEKYGWENFQHEIIAGHLTKEEACNFEIALIKALKSNQREFGYNKSSGGEGSSGVSPSEETRELLRNKFKGRKRPEGFGDHISQVKKGHSVSNETREKISNSLKKYYELNEKKYGSKTSKETREKQSKASKLRTNENYKNFIFIGRPINQYDLDGNFIKKWNSISEATKSLNFKCHGAIDNVLSGRAKTTHGFIFKYAENKEDI